MCVRVRERERESGQRDEANRVGIERRRVDERNEIRGS